MKRGLYERNWINIRPKSGVILVWDLPKVDADTQWATSRTNLRVLCTIVRSKLSKLQALSPGRSFLFAWPTVNTKSRLWPSVFSVRLFQTQCQLAAGDVSTNLSHFHWRSRTLGI